MANKWMTKMVSDFGIIASELKKNALPPLPTRSPSLTWATDAGGFLAGKIYCLYGPQQAGKSLLAYMCIADIQKRDPEAIGVWFDAEFSFSPELFIKMGGDPDRLIVRKTNDPLKIFDYIGGEMLELLQEGAPIKAIVIDSIKSIRYPKEVNKKQSTDMLMGGTGAAYLPSALKMVVPVVSEYNLFTFLIQQVSIEIDQMKAMRNPYVLPDGQALKHAADMMLEITKLDTKNGVVEKGETLTGSAAQVGHKVRVKVKKNRLGRPARVAQFTYHYDNGIVDTANEVFDLAKSLGIVFHPSNPDTGKENVQMWQFGNYDPIRGEQNMRNFVASDRKVQSEIMTACDEFKDESVQLDGNGFVNDPEDAVDLAD